MTCSLSLSTQTSPFVQQPSASLPSPAELSHALLQTIQAPQPEGVASALSQMGVPALDLTVTPLSARIGLLAARNGQGFFHHEWNGRIPVPEALAPEKQLWEGELVPVWNQGVLTEPKYFSFFLDGVFAPYNPNYRRKWRAHELLHGLTGFYWNPEMTRFSAYLGARLDELLPIVHWYGLDEAYRPRCARHHGVSFARELCSDCEAVAHAYWDWDASKLPVMQEHAERWIEKAWAHLDSEWAACIQELETGRRVETPRGHLNASSDAVGYLMSHWPRLTSWSLGTWCEMFLVDSLDYHSTIQGYMETMASVMQDVVSGTIQFDAGHSEQLRVRRALQDVGYRTLVAMEWLDEASSQAERLEDACMPLLEEAASLAHQMSQSVPQVQLIQKATEQIQAIVETFATTAARCSDVPDTVKRHFPMLGYCWTLDTQTTKSMYTPTASLPLLREGLESASSDGMQTYPEAFAKSMEGLKSFAESSTFLESGRLLNRFCSWYSHQDEADPKLLDWLRFEAFLFDDPRRDAEAELFAVIPDSIDVVRKQKGTLRRQKTFRRMACPGHIAHVVLGGVEEESIPLVAVIHEGEPSLLWLSKEMEEIVGAVEALEKGEQSALDQLNASHKEALEVLFENAFIVWLPAPL